MRVKKMREVLVDKELDALLISQDQNRRYLSGFTGSAGMLLITAERAILATDFRYYEQMGREAPAFELAKIETRFSDLLPSLVDDLGVQRLGRSPTFTRMGRHRDALFPPFSGCHSLNQLGHRLIAVDGFLLEELQHDILHQRIDITIQGQRDCRYIPDVAQQHGDRGLTSERRCSRENFV